jgi:hypothetical protein
MKFSFFVKSIPTLGLIAGLSVIAGTSIQQSVQAQSQPSEPTQPEQVQLEDIPEGIELLTLEQLEQRRLDGLEESNICDRVWQENSNSEEDGRSYFYDFKGLNLTDAQKQAYDALDAQAEARRADLYAQTIAVADPSAILSFLWLSEVVPDVEAKIQAALDLSPKMDQEAVLNEQFGNGQYGLFVGSYVTYLTPEQETELAQITTDFYSGVQALMTPEQQPQYSENLAARLRINEACDVKQPISSYPALGRVIEIAPDANVEN